MNLLENPHRFSYSLHSLLVTEVSYIIKKYFIAMTGQYCHFFNGNFTLCFSPCDLISVLQLLMLQPSVVYTEAAPPSLKSLVMDPYIILAAGKSEIGTASVSSGKNDRNDNT